jgi:hypothetical protein
LPRVGWCAVDEEAERYDLGTRVGQLAALPVVVGADAQLRAVLANPEGLQLRERSTVERDDEVP